MPPRPCTVGGFERDDFFFARRLPTPPAVQACGSVSQGEVLDMGMYGMGQSGTARIWNADFSPKCPFASGTRATHFWVHLFDQPHGSALEACMLSTRKKERRRHSPICSAGSLACESCGCGTSVCGCGLKSRNSKMGCPISKWKHGPKPAVCPSCSMLSHTHVCPVFGGYPFWGWSTVRPAES